MVSPSSPVNGLSPLLSAMSMGCSLVWVMVSYGETYGISGVEGGGGG